QVKRIVDLAASRHMTVVPEIDSPGHLGAVIAAHPDLQLRNVNGAAVRGAIDISKQKSADIVDDLLDEYAGLFPGRQWHLGGDEYQRSEEHTSELQSRENLVCRLLLEKKKKIEDDELDDDS